MIGRKNSIDLLKGILIILMIVGHIDPSGIPSSPFRFGIYSFHMPLFFGISGLLVNREKLLSYDFKEVWKKYWLRLTVPFIIAFLVYYFYVFRNDLGLSSFASNILSPFMHLWYVPTLMLFILITFLTKKWKPERVLTLSVLVCIPIIAYILKGDDGVIKVVLEKYKIHFFIFYFFGYYVRNMLKGSYSILFPLFILSIGIVMQTISFINGSPMINPGFYLLNLALILLTNSMINSTMDLKFEPINWIGRNSLSIYLWHVMALSLTKLWGPKGTQELMLAQIPVMILFLGLVFLLNKVGFVRKYLFGLN